MRAVILALALASGFVSAATDENYERKLSETASNILKKADKLTLYSLDPDPRLNDKNAFHDVHVLGSVDLKDTGRTTLLNALEKGIADDKVVAQACFNPRHGIRAEHEGKRVDIVVCFQCWKIKVFEPNDAEGKYVVIGRGPQPELDKLLTDAGVKLAPKAVEKK
ncbi:MAG TPA: hypothetical protein VEJ63_02060 [Planctomycetota bacterium]|nr:hypothetical protein [Planctomycetota bacterium]